MANPLDEVASCSSRTKIKMACLNLCLDWPSKTVKTPLGVFSLMEAQEVHSTMSRETFSRFDRVLSIYVIKEGEFPLEFCL